MFGFDEGDLYGLNIKEDNCNTWSQVEILNEPSICFHAKDIDTRRRCQLINLIFAFKVNYASTFQEGVYFYLGVC